MAKYRSRQNRNARIKTRIHARKASEPGRMPNKPKPLIMSGRFVENKGLSSKKSLIMSGLGLFGSYRPKIIFSFENSRVVIHRNSSANAAAQTAARIR